MFKSTGRSLRLMFAFVVFLIFLTAVFVLAVPRANAFDVELAWDASPSQDVQGYTIHYGTNSGYPKANSQAGPDATTATVAGLTTGIMYYFVVTAYDWEGRVSGPSNEVRTDGIVTPDTGQDPIAPGGCYIVTVTP